ncbi:hypothetical protein O181_006495 [Austropuccinia psidii MF-1]|uniref:Ubiquitin carboxyl-terminal hydrolase n=1 Tax=Austropuccinia psidii MF-1 TaxID=1389203 RepID=A0A9Q3GGX1_9BASI|nr:hypothetical protein [Austropuccinia psidii MF-1]
MNQSLSPSIDVKPTFSSPLKPTFEAEHLASPPPLRKGCRHQAQRLWIEENEQPIKNMIVALKIIESAYSSDFNLISFCLHCRSGTSPKVICLGCGAIFCYLNDENVKCYQQSHSVKHAKCHLGLDLVCRELICMVCGDIVQPDDQELKLLSRKLLPHIKKSCTPACLTRTTTNIFPPRGFRNLGNSCYMNVILQIILRIPELQSYLLTDHHNRLRHRTQDEIYCCACELVEILQHHSGSAVGKRQKSFDSISPVGFLYCLWMNSGDGEDFAGYRESDAHECLLACLNQLHSATQVSNNTDPTCQCPIHLLFRCELSSELVCGNCKKSSSKIDPILDLSLEIGHLSHLQQLRLEDCLESFTKSERLKEKCYTCPECDVASPDTTKSLKIFQLPHILCIQLKRFEHQGTSSVKLDRHVKFPLVLDMKPYTVHSQKLTDAQSPAYYYKLTGIVRHQGNVASGHYHAIVCQDEQYFCFNDSSVHILRLDEVLEIEAYILLLIRSYTSGRSRCPLAQSTLEPYAGPLPGSDLQRSPLISH